MGACLGAQTVLNFEKISAKKMPGAAPPRDPAFHLLLIFLMQKVLGSS